MSFDDVCYIELEFGVASTTVIINAAHDTRLHRSSHSSLCTVSSSLTNVAGSYSCCQCFSPLILYHCFPVLASSFASWSSECTVIPLALSWCYCVLRFFLSVLC